MLGSHLLVHSIMAAFTNTNKFLTALARFCRLSIAPVFKNGLIHNPPHSNRIAQCPHDTPKGRVRQGGGLCRLPQLPRQCVGPSRD